MSVRSVLGAVFLVPIFRFSAGAAAAHNLRTFSAQILFKSRPTLSLTRVRIIRQPASARFSFCPAYQRIAGHVGIVNVATFAHPTCYVFIVEDGITFKG